MRFLLPFLLVSCGGVIDAPVMDRELGDVVEQFEDDAVVDGWFDEGAGAFEDEYALTSEVEVEEPEVEVPVSVLQQTLVIKSNFDKVETGTFDCKYGGSVTVARTEVPPLLQIDWTFTACADKQNNTADGPVQYILDSSTSTVSYDATLTYTGKYAGTCVLTAQFTGEMAGKFKKHLCKIPKIKKHH